MLIVLITAFHFSFSLSLYKINERESGTAYEYYNYSAACSVEERKLLRKPFIPCADRISSIQEKISNVENISLMHDFLSVLTDRTFVFVGDSTVQMQYCSFCEALNSPISSSWAHWEKRDHEYFDYRVGASSREESFRKNCYVSKHNITALFLGYGRLYRWKYTQSEEHIHDITTTLGMMSSRDVIMFGIGVHWGYDCDNALETKQLLTIDNFEFALLKLLRMIPTIPKSAVHSTTQAYPYLVYRESLPQHFSSSNGQYPSFLLRPGKPEGLQLKCVALNGRSANGLGKTLDSIETSKLRERSKKKTIKSKTLRFKPPNSLESLSLSDCDPNCLPATWQNDVARSAISSQYSNIQMLELFHTLECIADEHSKKKKNDCTHYSPRINSYMNFELLRLVEFMKSKEIMS